MRWPTGFAVLSLLPALLKRVERERERERKTKNLSASSIVECVEPRLALAGRSQEACSKGAQKGLDLGLLGGYLTKLAQSLHNSSLACSAGRFLVVRKTCVKGRAGQLVG